jgi:RNA polymerase sigma factor (sigma-70 family)
MEVNVEAIALSAQLSPKAIEDYKLVLNAIDGNQKAYDELMFRHRDLVYSMVYKMVNNRNDAEDLTLEAFGKAFFRLESYIPRYSFSTWLSKIAVNNCIDYIRKRRPRVLSLDQPIQLGSEQNVAQTIASSALSPEEYIIHIQRGEQVRDLLQRLNFKYRQMIELRFYEEMSYEEISQELNIPLGTVKAQLFRAKEMLHGFMKKEVLEY